MGDLWRFRTLGVREQAVVALSVLLDGHDASDYLGSDKERSVALSRAAKDLAELAPELRMPLAGTLLRRALAKIDQD
ncbi:MAG: hypothetical protein KDD66_11045 [Bdellovibrionales bacterium]|nr:hypothetical protein [Bdellovibrionales bacterium]